MRSILEQRLRLAFNELSNPLNRDETIGSIAFRCGFVSDSHFTRLFRQVFGVRPTDAREAPPINAGGEPGLPRVAVVTGLHRRINRRPHETPRQGK